MDYIAITTDNYLEHHGILGQKWGVRRFQNKDGSLTSAGRQRRIDDKKQKGSAGMAFLTTTLLFDVLPVAAVITADRIDKGIKYRKEKRIREDIENSPIDKKTGFHKKTREMTEKEDLEYVNPSFNNFSQDSKNNCMLCTTSYDLRRRGLNVTAGKAYRGFTNEDLKKWYPKGKVNKIDGYELNESDVKQSYSNELTPKGYINHVIKSIESQGDSRGNLMVYWNGTYGGGHSMIYEVKDGKMSILDGQSNKIYTNLSSSNSPLNRVQTNGVEFMRLDNVEPNYAYLKKEGLIK
jgi:hypothetical protein